MILKKPDSKTPEGSRGRPICPACYASVSPPDANYCPNCGTDLGGGGPGRRPGAYAYIGLRTKPERLEEPERAIFDEALENAEKICRRYHASTETDEPGRIIATFYDAPPGTSAVEFAGLATLEIKEHCRRISAEPAGKVKLVFSAGIACYEPPPDPSADIFSKPSFQDAAKRLFAKAGPNTILISGEINKSFILKPVGFYRLKANEKPLKILELVKVKPAPWRFGEEPVVRAVAGREEQVAALKKGLKKTRESSAPGYSVILGESGAGKTEMLCEMGRVAAEEGWRVLLTNGGHLSKFVPYNAWRIIYEKAVSGKTGRLPDEELLLAAFGYAAPSSERSKQTGDIRTRIYEGISKLIELASGEAPLLVAIDDIHLVDCASAGFLRYFAERVKKGAVHVIATSRNDRGFIGNVAEKVKLGGFTDSAAKEIGEFIKRTYDLDPVAAKELFTQSRGNPLVFSWLAAASASKTLTGPETLDAYGPLNVPELAAKHLEALDKGSLELIEFLYLAGGPVRLKDLNSAAEVILGSNAGHINERLKWLKEFNLTALYNDSFGDYVGLPGYIEDALRIIEKGEPKTESRGTLNYLERTGKGARFLKGYAQLRHGRPDRAFDAFITSGEHALSVGADLDAYGILTSAVEMVETGAVSKTEEEIPRAYELRAEALRKTGLITARLENLEKAIGSYGPRAVPVKLKLAYAYALADGKRYEESLETTNQVTRSAHSVGDYETLTRGLKHSGDLYISKGELRRARETYDEVPITTQGNGLKAEILRKSGFAKEMGNRIKEAVASYEAAREAASDDGETAAAELYLASVLLDLGQFPRAKNLAVNALSSAADEPNRHLTRNDDFPTAIALLAVSQVGTEPAIKAEILRAVRNSNGLREFAFLDYFSLAEAYFSGDRARFETTDFFGRDAPWSKIISGNSLLTAASFRLHYDNNIRDTEFYATKALETFSEDYAYFRADCRLVLAETAAALGDYKEARKRLAEPEVLEKKRASYTYLAAYDRVFGTVLAREGDAEAGIAYVSAAKTLYENWGIAFHAARCCITLAGITDGVSKNSHYTRGLWLLENAGAHGWAERIGNPHG